MTIIDLLEFRELDQPESGKCQPAIKVSRLGENQVCLENNLNSFFEITYPSQLIKELIQFINSNMKNNKMRYREDERAIVVSGSHWSGKSHALLTAYNLFKDFDIAAEWLETHNIKFNKFNAFAIKNKSQSCIISALDNHSNRIWEYLFKELKREELLNYAEKVPSSTILRQLVGDQNTAIFIDDLEVFFKQLKKDNQTELIAKNKEFILNLLKEAAKNDNLMVFISMLGTADELVDITSEAVVKSTETIGEKKDFIFYHLFDELKNEQFRTNISPIVDSCIEEYRQVGINNLDFEQFKEKLVNSYPFHPELIANLLEVAKKHWKEIKDYKNEINILADLVRKHGDKDLLLAADFEIDILKNVFPKLYNGVQAELKRATSSLKKDILKTIFLYTIVDSKEAVVDNILQGVIRPREKNDRAQIIKELERLEKRSNYLKQEDDRYYILPKKSLTALINEQVEKVSLSEVKETLKSYIKDHILEGNYKFYSNKDWKDNPLLEYVVLLEVPNNKEELKDFLNQEVYDNLKYKNCLVFITPTEKLLAADYCHLIKELIVIENLIPDKSGEEKKKLLQSFKEKQTKLIELLTSAFGNYLKWVDKEGKLELEEVTFDLDSGQDPKEIIVNRSVIKNYILNLDQEVIDIKGLVQRANKDRKLPVIPNKNLIYQIVEDLTDNYEFVFIETNNELYRSLSVFLANKVEKVSDDQAKSKLINHLRYDLFEADYKIYGNEEIIDTAELQLVIILNDIISDNNLKSFLEENLYAGRSYKNSILAMKSTKNIFTKENIAEIKKEISLERLVKKWNQREKVISLLEQQREKVINKLKNHFGDYLKWSKIDGELKLKSVKMNVEDFRLNKLITTNDDYLKKTIMNRMNQLKSSIKTDDLLLEVRKNRGYPIIDQDNFYKTTDQLIKEGLIYEEEDTNRLYSQVLLSIKEEVEELQETEARKKVIKLIKNNLSNQNYKIYGYDQLEDNSKLEYLLLLEDNQEDLQSFLEQKIYDNLKFENSVVVIKVKTKLFTEDIITKTKELLAAEKLLAKNQNSSYAEELLTNTTEEVITELRTKFGYYQQWIKDEMGLKLEEKEVDLENIKQELRVKDEKLKENLIMNLRNRNSGINIEQLFLGYRKFRSYPLIIDKKQFDRVVKELIESKKIIEAGAENKIYGNTSALIKSTVQQVDNKSVKQRLVLYIKEELFNNQYNVFGYDQYDQIEDNQELSYVLLLGNFENDNKLQQILEKELYQDRKYKNNIVLYSSQKNVFSKEYIQQMKLVMGIESAQEKINWEASKIARILNKRKQGLNQKLESVFGDCWYWKKEDGQLKLTKLKLDKKLSPTELTAKIKVGIVELETDIIERMKKLEGIRKEELLSYYKQYREYPMVIKDDKFYHALEELRAENEVIIDEAQGGLYLNPLTAAEEKVEEITNSQAKKKLSYFIRDNLFNEDYKIYAYDQVEDKLQLEYLLLLDPPENNIKEFLNQEIYQGRKFANSLIVITPKEEIFTQDVMSETKRLIAVEQLMEKNQEVNYPEGLLYDAKVELISNTENKFGYYQQWVAANGELKLNEKEIGIVKINQYLESDLEQLKEHLQITLAEKELGINRDQLFAEYRENREYLLIIDRNLFEQALQELITEQKIINVRTDNKLYGTSDALINDLVQQISIKEVKQELVLYIRNKLFKGKYNVFGYDQIEDNQQLSYVLLLGDFEDRTKLQQILETELYQDLSYENTIVFYSSQQDVFNEEYLQQMKLVMSIRAAQEKINRSDNKFEDLLKQRQRNLKQKLTATFGNYLYWKEKDGELNLAEQSLAGIVTPSQLAAEIEVDLKDLKESIIEQLKAKQGITAQELLINYKKTRSRLVVVDETKFKQAISELKDQKKVIEEEGLYLNPIIISEEVINIDDIEKELAFFIRDNLFNENYKIYGYQEIIDKPELDYLLLLDPPQNNLEEFLKQQLYQNLEFKNSLIIIRPTEQLFTAKLKDRLRKLLKVKKLMEQNKYGNYADELLSNLKADLITDLKAKFAYYLRWIDSDEGLKLKEEKLELEFALSQLEVELKELKEHLRSVLKTKELGSSIDQLFLEYRRIRKYPLVINKDLFYQAVEQLIAEKKIISVAEDNKIYDNTSSLIKDTRQRIDNKEAKQRLVLYIREELFNEQYSIFAYDQVVDSQELSYLLLLGEFENKIKLQEILENKLYQGLEYQNNIILYSSKEDIFSAKYLRQMKLVMAIEAATEKINWEQSKVGMILDKRKQKLNQTLEEAFGNYLYWEERAGNLELFKEELDGIITTNELAVEAEVKLIDLKLDIVERLKNLSGIAPRDLLVHYQKFRDYPLIIEQDKFYQAITELKDEEKVIEEEGRLFLSPFVATEELEVSDEEVRESLAYFIRNNLFNKEYKIYGYEALNDSVELEYLLLLDNLEGGLKEFLEQQIYAEIEYKNSLVVIRPTEHIFTEETLKQMRKLMAMDYLGDNEQLDYSKAGGADLEEKLLNNLKDKFAYYYQWIDSESEILLKEKEIALGDIPNVIGADYNTLKEHILKNLRDRNAGITIEELFLNYRRFKCYPIIKGKALFNRVIEELISAQKLINDPESNTIFGNTSALIKSTVQQVSNKEAKQRLVIYIRNELFNGNYKIFGYDQVPDNDELKYLLLLGSFDDHDKLKKVLEKKLYQNREYKNNILLYSSQENVFKNKYVDKMKLVIGVESAQEKLNWDQSNIARILEKRKQGLSQLLKDSFGDYLYWQEGENGELDLFKRELEAKCSAEQLAAELGPDNKQLKEDLINRLKELAGIKREDLLTYYQQQRKCPVIIDQQNFYQVIEELITQNKIIEKEGKLYSDLESLVEVKTDQINDQRAKEELAAYLADNLFDDQYAVYGYNKLPDNPNLNYLVLLEYFPKKIELEQFIKEKVLADINYKGTIAIITPKEDINKLLDLMKRVLASKNINVDAKLAADLLKVREDKLKKKAKETFANYLYWSREEEEVKLKLKEIKLEELGNVIKTDKVELKSYLLDRIYEQVKISDLLAEIKTAISSPLLSSEQVFYQALEELVSEEKLVLISNGHKLDLADLDQIEAEMLVADFEAPIRKQEEKEENKVVDDEVEEDNYEILDLFA